jgi:hypothetical protein
LTSVTTRRGMWASHTASNVTSATRIVAQLLHRTGDEPTAVIANRQAMCLLRTTDGATKEGGLDDGSLTSLHAYG